MSHKHHYCVPQKCLFIDIKQNVTFPCTAKLLPSNQICSEGDGSLLVSVEYDQEGQIKNIITDEDVQVLSFQLICDNQTILCVFGNAPPRVFQTQKRADTIFPSYEDLYNDFCTRNCALHTLLKEVQDLQLFEATPAEDASPNSPLLDTSPLKAALQEILSPTSGKNFKLMEEDLSKLKPDLGLNEYTGYSPVTSPSPSISPTFKQGYNIHVPRLSPFRCTSSDQVTADGEFKKPLPRRNLFDKPDGQIPQTINVNNLNEKDKLYMPIPKNPSHIISTAPHYPNPVVNMT